MDQSRMSKLRKEYGTLAPISGAVGCTLLIVAGAFGVISSSTHNEVSKQLSESIAGLVIIGIALVLVAYIISIIKFRSRFSDKLKKRDRESYANHLRTWFMPVGASACVSVITGVSLIVIAKARLLHGDIDTHTFAKIGVASLVLCMIGSIGFMTQFLMRFHAVALDKRSGTQDKSLDAKYKYFLLVACLGSTCLLIGNFMRFLIQISKLKALNGDQTLFDTSHYNAITITSFVFSALGGLFLTIYFSIFAVAAVHNSCEALKSDTATPAAPTPAAPTPATTTAATTTTPATTAAATTTTPAATTTAATTATPAAPITAITATTAAAPITAITATTAAAPITAITATTAAAPITAITATTAAAPITATTTAEPTCSQGHVQGNWIDRNLNRQTVRYLCDQACGSIVFWPPPARDDAALGGGTLV